MNTALLSTKNMVRISMLSLLGAIFTILNFTIPFFFPPFLSIDVGDVPSVVGAIFMGPGAGVLIQFIKNVVKALVDTSTGGVGEFANFIIGTSYILPFAFVYHRLKGLKGFVIGSISGTLSMMLVGAFANYFVFVPFYATLFGGMETVIAVANAVNPNITDPVTLIIIGITPFNLLKGTLTSIVAFLVYRSIKPIIERREAQ